MDFRMTYDNEKNIENLYYQFNDPNHSDKSYTVSSSIEGKLRVEVNKLENQYDTFTPTYQGYYITQEISEFLKVISNIKFAKSPHEQGKIISSYDIKFDAYNYHTSSTNLDDEYPIYLVGSVDNNNNIKYRKATLRELPVQGVLINYSPMEKVRDGYSSSTNTDTYVIYPNTNESLIKENSEKLSIENLKDNKKLDLIDHDYKINEIIEVLEFSTWEKTDEESINSNEYIVLKGDSNMVIKIYENNYAIYEDKDEKIVYKIPATIVESLIDTI